MVFKIVKNKEGYINLLDSKAFIFNSDFIYEDINGNIIYKIIASNDPAYATKLPTFPKELIYTYYNECPISEINCKVDNSIEAYQNQLRDYEEKYVYKKGFVFCPELILDNNEIIILDFYEKDYGFLSTEKMTEDDNITWSHKEILQAITYGFEYHRDSMNNDIDVPLGNKLQWLMWLKSKSDENKV